MLNNRGLLRGDLRFPGHGIETVVLIALMVAIGLAPTASAQQMVRLPIEASLSSPRLELDLSDAKVRITFSSEQSPRFSARLEAEDASPEVLVEATIQPGVTKVRRTETMSNPGIIVEITLAVDQNLAINGNRIDLEIFGAEPEAPTGTAEPTDVPDTSPVRDRGGHDQANENEMTGTPVTVVVEDSRLAVTNLRGFSLTALRGTNNISFTSSHLALDLYDSEAHIHGHYGHAELVSVESNSVFVDGGGTISAALEGGQLTVNQGEAGIKGTLGTADVVFDGVSGPISLTGNDSSISIANTANVPIQVTGEDLRVSLSDLGGALRAKLTQGSLEADSISGRVDLQLIEDAEGDLDDVRGDLAAVVSSGARVVIRGVEGHTRVQLQDGEMEVADLKSLDLEARRALFTGSGIRALTRLKSQDSTLDLDLYDIEGRPKIELHGSSEAMIRLKTPCRVVAKMPRSPLGDNLRVTGCLLDFDGARKKGESRGVDGRMPLRLDATLDEAARLEVDGTP